MRSKGRDVLRKRRRGRDVLRRRRAPAPLPQFTPPDLRGRTREEMSEALMSEGVDPVAEADMISCIRRIIDAAGLDVPFLDDAVQILVDEQERAKRELNVLRSQCHEHQRCIQCAGLLDTTTITGGHERCNHCFRHDYEKFVGRHKARLTQLPEPRPEASSMRR